MRAVARWLIVAITISSWIALSNHCALSAIAAKPQTTHTACPFHSEPAKPQSPQPIGIECCKILRGVSNAPAKNLAPAIVDLPNANLPFIGFTIFTAPKIFVLPATLDTGPPGRTSFVELNRSVRAHAPPVLS